ncbi:ABC transporter substrate-binding protein [Gordoniibacillus kamchatkensis]|uniref:ABC transporter substrate-binding protein n=1 Tax=Gordoniibacillus kamchatkensis TaxID=1590651 RepID=A0ABR5AJ35_9BACL|nr:extracellular solute-binding protein [Paenibacillus sp. VKM B-2647]KIL40570.1 ABC transporter substrate-binding protein [Paenibacillus sp. VKM B-2647]
MKKTLLVSISLIMTLTIAACSSSTSVEGEPTKPIAKKSDMTGTVRVALAGWQLDNGIDAQTGAESIGLNQFLKETFNKMYPNIKLEIYQIPWENARAKQYAMLLSKDVDILYTGGAFASQWYQEGLLRNIDDLIKADSSFDPGIYLDGIWNNSYSTKSLDKTHQYGLPAILGRRMTIYDKKLFDDWGVPPLSSKATPEEIMNAAMKMTGKNPKTGEQNYGIYWSGNSLNGSTIVGLALAFGAKGAEGSLSDMKNIKWQLNSPEMVKVLEWLKKMAPYAPPGFVNGQGAESFGVAKNVIAIGLDQSGGATMSDFRVNKDKANLDRFVPAMNVGPKGETWVAVDPFVMAKDVKDQKAAWEVMKFLAGPETQKHNYKYFASTPTLKNPDFITAEDKFVKEALKIADVAHSELLDEANPFYMSDIVPAINGFVSQAAKGNAPDAKAFLDDLQKRAEAWSKNLK